MTAFTTPTPHRPLLRYIQVFILLASVCGMYFLCALRYPIMGPTAQVGLVFEPAHEIMSTLVPRGLRGTVLVDLDEDDLPPPEAAVEAVVEEKPEPVAAKPVPEVPVETAVEETPPAYEELDPSPPSYTADPPAKAEVADSSEFDWLFEGYGELPAAADAPVPDEKTLEDVKPEDLQADTAEKSGRDWLFDGFDAKYPSIDDFDANFDAVKEKAREPLPEVKTPLVDDKADTVWDGKWESDLSDNFDWLFDNFYPAAPPVVTISSKNQPAPALTAAPAEKNNGYDWLFDSSSSSREKKGTVENGDGYKFDSYSDTYEDPYGWGWEDYHTYSKGAAASETQRTPSPTMQRTPSVTRLATAMGQAPKQTRATRPLDKLDDTSGAGKGSRPQMWVLIVGILLATSWLAPFVNQA